MYQMYMPLAKAMLKKVEEECNSKTYDSPFEKNLDFLNLLMKNLRAPLPSTDSWTDIAPYAIVKCIKVINPDLANTLKSHLDNIFTAIERKPTNTVEQRKKAFLQRTFAYSLKHVKETVLITRKYLNSLPSNKKSVLNDNVLNIVNLLDSFITDESFNETTIDMLTKKLEETGINPEHFCDNIESRLKVAFVENFNEATNSTNEKILNTPNGITHFTGEEFNLLIHSSNDSTSFLDNTYDQTHPVFSTSIIDNHNIRTYQSGHSRCFAFLSPLSEETLIAPFFEDAATSVTDGAVRSSISPDYVELDVFKKRTETESNMGFSELMITNKLKPDVLVCFDHILKEDLELASNYNLRIVLIETENYPEIKRNDHPEYFQPHQIATAEDISLFEENYAKRNQHIGEKDDSNIHISNDFNINQHTESIGQSITNIETDQKNFNGNQNLYTPPEDDYVDQVELANQ